MLQFSYSSTTTVGVSIEKLFLNVIGLQSERNPTQGTESEETYLYLDLIWIMKYWTSGLNQYHNKIGTFKGGGNECILHM